MTEIPKLTTYQYLNLVLRRIADESAMCSAYKKWSDEYSRKELRRVWSADENDPFERWKRRVTVAELQGLTETERYSLGFLAFKDGQCLVPLWAFNYIADGEEFTSITGEEVVKGTDYMDLDVRAGCLAFWFPIEE